MDITKLELARDELVEALRVMCELDDGDNPGLWSSEIQDAFNLGRSTLAKHAPNVKNLAHPVNDHKNGGAS